MYPDLDSIYQRHVKDTKFDVVKGSEFKSLKKRLAFLCHLLKEHPGLAPDKRTELIHAFLSEDDLRHAQQVIPKSDKSKDTGKPSFFSKFTAVLSWSKGTDEESLRKEMKKVASDISDSNFLLELKGMEEEDLKAAIEEAEKLAHTQLASFIDLAVNKMTHPVLKMQQDECKKSVRHEVETEERKVLDNARVNFIQDVNKNSAGQRPSCVWYSCSDCD